MAKAKTFAEIMAEVTDDQLFGVSTFEDEDSSATTQVRGEHPMTTTDRQREIFEQRLKGQDDGWIAYHKRAEPRIARAKRELANAERLKIMGNTSATSTPFALLLKKED